MATITFNETETEVFKLIAQGYTDLYIQRTLHRGAKSIQRYKLLIYSKLGLTRENKGTGKGMARNQRVTAVLMYYRGSVTEIPTELEQFYIED